ncbi:uncharacterized protein LOC118651522 [Myotis myotis]|uniref:uncharacterized protein LOC118651522 n=1 Tax=Myotis myotis TaxID=51298 RepID=UPI00174892E3|nr:uncharacterized protein LOC118651522 [Myotis myotis]
MAATGFGELHVAPHGTVWVGWGEGPRPLASGTLASECGVWMGGGGRACKPPGGLGVGPPLAQFPGSPAQPRDSCDGCAQLPAGCGRAQGSRRQKGCSRPSRRQSLLVCATVNLLGRGLHPSAMCEVQDVAHPKAPQKGGPVTACRRPRCTALPRERKGERNIDRLPPARPAVDGARNLGIALTGRNQRPAAWTTPADPAARTPFAACWPPCPDGV